MTNISEPVVSVIVPVLDTRPYLAACLDSLLAQTLTSLEVICIDNGSTDGSMECLREYAKNHSRLHVLRAPREGRLGAARNAGMTAARGEFIGFVDSDDFVSPSMFEDLHRAAVESAAEMAICNMSAFYQKDGRRVTMIAPQRLKRDGGFEIRQRPDLLRNLTSCNRLYSKTLLERLSLRFPEGFYHEDQFFVPRALFGSRRIVTVPECHYVYRKQRDGAIGLHRGAHNLHIFRVMQMLMDTLTPTEREIFRGALAEMRIVRYLTLFTNTGGLHRREFYRLMKKDFRETEIESQPLFLHANERREFHVVRQTRFAGHALFRAARALYATLRDILKTGRPLARHPELLS